MSGHAARPAPPLTAEQRAAVAARQGSWLLAANAGSGKTAVMAERFVRAVLDDGVPASGILALTFTEKAASELRNRIRARLAHERPGAGDEAEASWVGTIHGFCARVLRAHALAADLDPRFRVLDEAAAGRLQRRAFERALTRWVDAGGRDALDLAAAYGAGLEPLVRSTCELLRSRGQTVPVLPRTEPPVPPDLAVLGAALEPCAALLAAAHAERPGRQLAARLDDLGRCRERLAKLAASGEPPPPAALERLTFGGGTAAALKSPEAEAFRAALDAARQAALDSLAHRHLEQLGSLLTAYAGTYASAKRGKSAVDFGDLELGVRDLFAGRPDVRRRWAERFALLMVDEFQDTNPLQMELLSMLDRDNLFAVGDERQSIYGFRHADVGVMRRRRAGLPPERVLPLARNFRSREELLDVVNAAFSPLWRDGFQPLVAGRREDAGARGGGDGELRLFDPDRPQAPADRPPVELLLVAEDGWELEDLGLEQGDASPARRAEARAVADRVARLGRPLRDVVVLVRATSSLRLFEEALEERGVRTYVVGGRGYWSLEQVRDGLAYLAVVANPLDEEALLGVLASPFAGLGTDGLVLAAEAGRRAGGLWAALCAAVLEDGAGGHTADARDEGWLDLLPESERRRLERLVRFLAAERPDAPRHSLATLLERALVATGYDAAVLARAGGDRRLANLRKLMRLAREFEAAEGRDLRGFLEHAAAQARRLAEAREGQAPLESEALDAVRLMTVHAAKGLEFPVVVVPDLGRAGQSSRPRLLVGPDGRVGLRVAAPAGEGGDALAYAELARAAADADEAEEKRLLYVAFTRAEDLLIVSGCASAAAADPRPGGPPLAWIAPALLGRATIHEGRPDAVVEREWDGRRARVAARFVGPGAPDARRPAAAARGDRAVPAPRDACAPATAERVEALPAAEREALPVEALPAAEREALLVEALPAAERAEPVPAAAIAAAAAAPAPPVLSYSALADYSRCGYRFYLRRVLGLPEVPPPDDDGDPDRPAGITGRLSAMDRGTLVHALLERADLVRARPPDIAAVEETAAALGHRDVAAEDAEDAARLVDAFLRTPLAARLARARDVRREAPFAFILTSPGATAPLVHGVLDAVARERDGTVLVVDYKTDRVGPDDHPEAVVARSYRTQRITYALAALRDGARRVDVAYCFLARPDEPVHAVFTAEDAALLETELADLAGGVLAGRYPVTQRPHRDLCATCPGRARLCSWPPEATLRQPISAGTFSGSGGPS